MSLLLLPDVEALVSQFLRAQDEITDLVDERVYTVIPKNAAFPLLLAHRPPGGLAVTSRPLYLDAALVQLDAYGGSKGQARNLIETARAVLAARLEGVHESGVVTGVQFGSMGYLPDPDFTPARPRYVADLTVWVRPQPAGS